MLANVVMRIRTCWARIVTGVTAGSRLLGLSPQPVLLGILPNAACVLMPSPDLLLLMAPPATAFTLNVPPAARPVQVWSQVVRLDSGGGC